MLLRSLFMLCALFSQTGCVYALLGVKHDYDVSSKLVAGMTRTEALAAISDGGSITLGPEIPRPDSGNWADAIKSDEVLAKLLLKQAREQRQVVVVVPISRHWGFMGYGVFHFFLDEKDELVGHHLFHVN